MGRNIAAQTEMQQGFMIVMAEGSNNIHDMSRNLVAACGIPSTVVGFIVEEKAVGIFEGSEDEFDEFGVDRAAKNKLLEKSRLDS